MTDLEIARIALACLDLTTLNPGDTEADVQRLCERALTPHGAVAAVCVWPRFAALARASLPPQVAVAAVANFPDGSADVARALADVATIVQAGAQEVDLVLPWATLKAGDQAACARLLGEVRAAASGLTLKVILETGELKDPLHIQRACQLALDAGADFLKTSTGTTPLGATPEAARLLLQSIAALNGAAARRVGFKASGGIRSVADARQYIELTRTHLGALALVPARFRIGASSLLTQLLTVLDGASPGAPAAEGY
jgi:deoxyribose-phosphate aldolase